MKYLVQTACAAALIGLSGNVYAAVNGINYDPAHSKAWIDAQGVDPPPNNVPSDPQKMEDLFKRDLDQIKQMGFNTIKTYYSKFCGFDGKCLPDDIAKTAQDKGIQVLLGVFEFRPGNPAIGQHADGCNDLATCKSWTQGNIDAAIDQANKYPGTVIGIVVGNEDMFNDLGSGRFVADPETQKRIVDDITTIKGKVSIPVTTAQRQPDWCGGDAPGCDPSRHDSINQTNPNGILGKIAVAGVNIFPYWSPDNIPEKTGCNGGSVALCTQTAAQNVLNALMKVTGTTVTSVIVTEEGWPSCYPHGSGQHPTDSSLEDDYFTNWKLHQNQVFDSYYFMAYDLSVYPVFQVGCPTDGADANNYFGLCDANGSSKSGLSISCPQPVQGPRNPIPGK